MVVTDISLVGWLVSSADSATAHRVVAALVAVAVITASGFIVHFRIERRIDALEDL
jgi:HAMP domain-containing protein